MILAIFLLSACNVIQPALGLPQASAPTQPAYQPLPSPTFAPASTMFDILPKTGAVASTPSQRYDPLLATLTAGSANQTRQAPTGDVAALVGAGPGSGDSNALDAIVPTAVPTISAEQPTVIPPSNAPQDNGANQNASKLPTGRLFAPILGLIPSAQGLWAMRADGTQATLLTNDPISNLATSPGGTMAAYLTNVNGSAAFDQPFGYELKIITLFNDQVYTITGLAPQGLGPNSPQPALDSAYQTLLTYGRGALAWSPDGSRLAFVSGHEGNASQPEPGNVYIYTPSAGKLVRVSNLSLPTGPAHAYGLGWSRDGEHLYYAAAYGFGQNASDMAGAWIYSLNGSTMQVAPERQSVGEHLEAWLPTGAVLLSSRGACGDDNLRMVDYRTGNAQVIWAPCYTDLLYTRADNEAVISLTPDIVDPSTGLGAGVYVVSLWSQQPAPRQITNTGFTKIYQGDYRAAWYGFNPAQGLTGIQRNGTLLPTFSGPPFDGSQGEIPQPMGRLPDNVTWLWSGPSGLFTARPGSQPKAVLNVPPQHFVTSPTRVGLYFYFAPDQNGVTRLYEVSARDWQPQVVDNQIENPNDLVWVP